VLSKSRLCSLSRRADFLDLKSNGQSFHVNAWLLVNLRTTTSDRIRCGWTIPKQIGKAVLRNRFRRWGREYLRKWAVGQSCSLDMNLIFKRRGEGFYKSVSHEEFDEAMEKMVAKLERYFK